jgi:hypothetical protein
MLTNHTPTEVLFELLSSLGLFTNPTEDGVWPLYTGFLPDEQKESAGLYDTAGVKHTRFMQGGTQEYSGIQLRVRARNYTDARLKLQAVCNAMDNVSRTIIILDSSNGYEIRTVHQTGGIAYLGFDPAINMYEFTVNFTMDIHTV